MFALFSGGDMSEMIATHTGARHVIWMHGRRARDPADPHASFVSAQLKIAPPIPRAPGAYRICESCLLP